MSLAIGDEHELLAEAVARFASQRCAPAVARAAMEADAAELPPFWAELDGLGWLTHAPADGLGFSELAIVLEGLGRAVAPGPILATAWARAVAGLAGVAIDGPAAVAADARTPTLGGAAARAIVRRADDGTWSMVPAGDLERTPVPGLYLCGAGTHPGGGVTGGPGANAAREILRDLG